MAGYSLDVTDEYFNPDWFLINKQSIVNELIMLSAVGRREVQFLFDFNAG